MATIPFRPRTAARRTKSQLAEVPARSDLASIDTSSRCRNSHGAVIVQMLEPKISRTFDEYFSIVFATYVLKQLENAKRVYLVWDVYLDDSLKKSLREKRGAGQRRKVMGSTRIPCDWKSFLRVDGNKEELLKLLADKVCIDLACSLEYISETINEISYDITYFRSFHWHFLKAKRFTRLTVAEC